MTEYKCDCYETPGYPDPDCPHPESKRAAFIDELTDAQLKLLFHGEQEKERMKQEKAKETQNKSSMQNQI